MIEILLFLLFEQLAAFPYQFNATSQYLLIENESQDWTKMKIQVFENNIKQSEKQEDYEQYLELYYRVKIGTFYQLDIELSPNQSYLIKQVNDKDCPKQCSNNGNCINSTCQCDQNYLGQNRDLYKGPDANLRQTQKPVQINLILNQKHFKYFTQCSSISNQIQLMIKGIFISLKQRQTKNLLLATNQMVDVQLYMILPFQQADTSMTDDKLLYNATLNKSTTINYSSFYQSYSVATVHYGFLCILTNRNLNKTSYSLTFDFASAEVTFQDFILVTILSVVAFIILLIVIFIVRKRCQYISISKLKYIVDAQPQNNIIGQLPIVAPAKDEECIVCLDILEKEQCRQTHCKHIFHEKCLNEWLQKQNTCPLCRECLLEEDGQQVLKLRNLSSSTIVQGHFSLIQSERQPIQQVVMSRSMSSRLAAFQ